MPADAVPWPGRGILASRTRPRSRRLRLPALPALLAPWRAFRPALSPRSSRRGTPASSRPNNVSHGAAALSPFAQAPSPPSPMLESRPAHRIPAGLPLWARRHSLRRVAPPRPRRILTRRGRSDATVPSLGASMLTLPALDAAARGLSRHAPSPLPFARRPRGAGRERGREPMPMPCRARGLEASSIPNTLRLGPASL